jgi:hypothetical protein
MRAQHGGKEKGRFQTEKEKCTDVLRQRRRAKALQACTMGATRSSAAQVHA